MTDRLATIQERLDAATPGPWTWNRNRSVSGPHRGEFRAPSPYNGFMLAVAFTNEADAELIAHAPDDLRALLAIAKAARELVDRYCSDGMGVPAFAQPLDAALALLDQDTGAVSAAAAPGDTGRE